MAQNVIINGVTYQNVPSVEIPKSTSGTAEFFDTSDATLDSGGKMLAGNTAYADGTKYTGTIETKTSSDVTASGATVSVPAGYYASSVSKSVASGSAKPAASVSATNATFSAGNNTITLIKSVSTTPQVTAGYISSGTSGNTNVTLSTNVTTKAEATYTPTTSDQTIASGTYLTGAQTISGDANLVASNIKSGVSIFGVAGTGTDMLSAIAPERIDNTSGITDVTVSGITVNTSPVVIRSGYVCTLDCDYTLTATLSSETTVATGLPPRVAGAIVDVMQATATSFARPMKAIVNANGDLKLRYGAAGRYWVHMAYISSVPNAGVADADSTSY